MRVLRVLSHVPPPLLFVVPLLLGLRWERTHPLHLLPASLVLPARVTGAALTLFGAVLALSAIALFIHRRTTIVPHHRSRTLITTGPFRLTRNPMYVALACIFAGVCLFSNAAWPLMFIALPLFYVHAITIPREERLLREAFGAEYDDYASRVQRWL